MMFAVVSCKNEIVDTNYGTTFERKGSKGKWNCLSNGEKKILQKFDHVEPIDIEVNDHVGRMWALHNGQTKYMLDAAGWYNPDAGILLDGHPFEYVDHDNEGYAYAKTPYGIYALEAEKGLPTKLATIWRTRNELARTGVIYSFDGENFGASSWLPKHSGSWGNDFLYKEIIPTEWKEIIHVYGSGANHYVALRGDEMAVFDEFGYRKEMGYKVYLSKRYWLKVDAGDKDVATKRYVDLLRSIPIDGQPHKVPLLRSMCTRTGDSKVSTVFVNAISKESSYNGPYFPGIGGASD